MMRREVKNGWEGKIYEGCIELGLDWSIDRNLRERIVWWWDEKEDIKNMSEDIGMIGIVMRCVDKEKLYVELLREEEEGEIGIGYCDNLYSMYLERMVW